jgi:hypothetical protein
LEASSLLIPSAAAAGASFRTKVPSGDRLNVVCVRGRHLFSEGYVDAPSSPAEPDLALALVLLEAGVVVVVRCPRPPMSCLAPPRAVAAERVMPPRGCFAAWASLWSSRMLVLPKLFAVVVAWSSLVTDVALSSTSGSCCRVCDAPSRMLCHVGLGGRLGRLSRWIPTTAATSPE